MKIFLTGRPGSGKSTVIQKILEELKKRKVKVAGILTPEIRADSRKGFEIIDIASGKKGILAAIGIKGPKVSKYGVNISDIDKIVDKFLESFDDADICLIDEISKMEYFSEKFKAMIQKILAGKKPLIATLHRAFVKDFQEYGEVIWVDKNNREKLPEEILKKIFLS